MPRALASELVLVGATVLLGTCLAVGSRESLVTVLPPCGWLPTGQGLILLSEACGLQ